MYRKNTKVILTVLLSLALVPNVFSQTVQQMPKLTVFGEQYHTLPAIASDKARVIYYRTVSGEQRSSGANVYVDGHYHTSLLTGGFSTFCLLPGEHTLGAYRHDAPLYRGKTEELYRVKLEAGKTYFIKVSDDGKSAPVSVTRAEAEQELKYTREQKHAVSRAAVLTCK
jgi:OOP family OmpA-OmpF porin